MNRRILREQLFKLLFRVEFNPKEDMPEQCELFFADSDVSFTEADIEYISGKYQRIADKIPELDRKIEDNIKGWSMERLGRVELTILRLGLYELLYDEDIPDGVAINEAVELSKRFGQEEAYSFINGVLSNFAKK